MRLENLVKERTAEVVRLEKIASVGKLTQGLIDRILNPLNYINNFSKLSQGLVKDVTANIEDEKDHMDEEIYEDTMDVLDMLKGNLEKVSEHGANTTRTLKAMEEMLKDRSGGMVKMDLNALMKQDQEMLMKYYEKDIATYHIKVAFNLPEASLMINGNADQLSKTVMSLLGNAVYAVIKKVGKHPTGYTPEIILTLSKQDNLVTIKIHDNGTGISENIIHKIFDPFFTTKTTAEASGVGLYLSKEIAQNHGGDIAVDSTKDEYTEFTIHIPTL
jgi:signal transduction histidine kinase